MGSVERVGLDGEIVVPIAYTVLHTDRALEGEVGPSETDWTYGRVRSGLLHQQTQALNRAFRGTGIRFVTGSIAYWSTLAANGWGEWAEYPGPVPIEGSVGTTSRDVMAAFGADPLRFLNVFVVRASVQNLGTWPWHGESRRTSGDLDGAVLHWRQLPFVPELRDDPWDRSLRHTYQGDTLVHLVGHYLGLEHTFAAETDDETCSPGDSIRDTPAHQDPRVIDASIVPWQLRPVGLCRDKDTCPDYPGLDPIENFMTVESDLCASEFTPGQVRRMRRMVQRFRPWLFVDQSAGMH
jgi:hypothetical protein